MLFIITTRHAELEKQDEEVESSSQKGLRDAMPRENPASCRNVQCPDHVLKAIYSTQHIVDVSESDESHAKRVVIDDELRKKKLEEYDANLAKWWQEYAARKNSEDEEHVCDSLLYDFSHLPRTTPAPNYLEDRVVQTMGAKEVVHKTTTTVETKKAPSAAK